MRIIALLATFNNERFIASVIEHLSRHGVQVHVLDNSSTDRTVAIAEQYYHHGLIGVENKPRSGVFDWKSILARQEEIGQILDADWFMLIGPDEFFLPPRSDQTLTEAFAEVEAKGANAVNFMEFAFVATAESPDHDHADFQKTMRWYYPFKTDQHHRVVAWKKQPERVDLKSSGGHHVRFPGQRIHLFSFPMKHYLILSRTQAIEKYAKVIYLPEEVSAGWHGWRAQLKPEMIVLPPQSELRTYISDDQLDASNPRSRHMIEDAVLAFKARELVKQMSRANTTGEPLISTVLLNWNRVELLKRTVESYLSTISVPYELIIVDNASTDGSHEFISSVCARDPRHRAILLDENLGGEAINRGVEVTRGRIIHIAEYDMEYLPGWDESVLVKFAIFPKLGQICPLAPPSNHDIKVSGLRLSTSPVVSDGVTIHVTEQNVSTTSMCRRELWDRGLRWNTIQSQLSSQSAVKQPDDGAVSHQVRQLGYWVAWNDQSVVINWGHRVEEWQKNPEYYLADFEAKPWVQEGGLRGQMH